MIIDRLMRLLFCSALFLGGARLAGITNPYEFFNAIYPYEKLERLAFDTIRKPWPNVDVFQGEPSEFFDVPAKKEKQKPPFTCTGPFQTSGEKLVMEHVKRIFGEL